MNLGEIEKNLDNFKNGINQYNFSKSTEISIWIKLQRLLDLNSQNNSRNRIKGYHPIRPVFGEVFAVDYGSNVGFEFKDLHLGLIFQNDNGNKYGDTTIVLPITDYKSDEKFDSNIHFILKNEHFESVEKNGLDKDPSKIKLSDITTIDKARLDIKIGKLKPEVLLLIKKKLRKILYL